MPDPLRPTFRVVGAVEPAPRKRGPGLAVVAISVYAVLFVGALWTFQYSRARARGRATPPKVEAPLAPPDRPALLAGTGLVDAARQKYLARIGADHCDCGCKLTLSACLAGDVQCVRSPELARRRLLAAR